MASQTIYQIILGGEKTRYNYNIMFNCFEINNYFIKNSNSSI